MQIDPRTMVQLLQTQSKSAVDPGNIESRAKAETDRSLFDILLQELMRAESGDTAGQEETLSSAPWTAGDLGMLSSGRMGDDSAWEGLPGLDTESFAALSQLLAAQSSVSSSAAAGDLEPLITQAAQKYGVSASLIKAVIETESSFNPQAVSSAGAKGLMQLMDGTAQGLGVTDPFDPAQNIDAGTRYLAAQIKRFGGDENTALAAYNAGPGRLAKLGISGDSQLMEKLELLPGETQQYIVKIAAARAKYEG